MVSSTRVDRVRGDGPLAGQLAHALEHLLGADEAAAALTRALEDAGLDALPEDPEEVVFFATGALHSALEASFGRPRANALVLALAPVLDGASQLRASRPDAPASAPQGSAPPRSSPRDCAVPSSTPPTSELVRRDSGLRRSVQPTTAAPRPGDTVEEVAKADTIPAPSSRSAELAGRAVMAPVSPIEISGGEPSSRRFTVPYLPKALVRKSRTPAAVVVDADEGSREELCTWLRSMGCVVAAAGDGAQARSLLRRSRAGLLIADVETIAPDYEPIGPVLEELVRGLDTVTVVLLSEEPQRARCATATVLPKPTSRARLLTTIEPLLARKREQG